MDKLKFKKDRLGFKAGAVIPCDQLREGLVKTLLAFDVVEIVNGEEPKLDVQKDEQPSKPRRKSQRSKKSPSGGGE